MAAAGLLCDEPRSPILPFEKRSCTPETKQRGKVFAEGVARRIKVNCLLEEQLGRMAESDKTAVKP
jgi:hypothetical protein